MSNRIQHLIIASASFGIAMGVINSCGARSTTVREKTIIHERSAAPQTTFDCVDSYSSECQDLLKNGTPQEHI